MSHYTHLVEYDVVRHDLDDLVVTCSFRTTSESMARWYVEQINDPELHPTSGRQTSKLHGRYRAI